MDNIGDNHCTIGSFLSEWDQSNIDMEVDEPENRRPWLAGLVPIH